MYFELSSAYPYIRTCVVPFGTVLGFVLGGWMQELTCLLNVQVQRGRLALRRLSFGG